MGSRTVAFESLIGFQEVGCWCYDAISVKKLRALNSGGIQALEAILASGPHVGLAKTCLELPNTLKGAKVPYFLLSSVLPHRFRKSILRIINSVHGARIKYLFKMPVR